MEPRVAGPSSAASPPCSLASRARCLELAHRPALVGGAACEPPTGAVVGGDQQRPAVALAESAALEQLERLVGQVEQANEVGDGDAAAADPQADLLAREAELLDERGAGARLLDRVEVLARHVLDQRELERLGVVARAHERRDRLEAGELRRAPAALAGDQLEAAVGGAGARAPAAARRASRIDAGERGERLVVEVPARLARVGRDQLDRDLAELLDAAVVVGRDRHDRGEAAAHAARAAAPPAPPPSGQASEPRCELIADLAAPAIAWSARQSHVSGHAPPPRGRARRRPPRPRSRGRAASRARRSSAPR